MSYNLDIKQGPVDVQFFKGGTTNICYNAIDRHVEAGKGDKVAFYWEGNEPGIDSRYVRTLPF
jgi:acetyl-CoA synthetase